MNHVTDLEQATAAALAPLRVTSDPAAAVPPCLLIDAAPKYVRPSACGLVWEWTALLIPAQTTAHLADLWLADELPSVLDRIPAAVTAAEPVLYTQTEAGAGSVTAYQITFQA